MAIFRVHNNEQYTAMSNLHLRDTSLSLQAMGLLSFMLSCNDSFKFSIEGLTQCSSSGETTTRSTLKELRDKGYLQVTRITNEHGKVVEWAYDVYEEPLVEKPHVENPHLEKPHVENQGQRIISSTKVESIINNKRNIKERTDDKSVRAKRFVKPSVEEVQAYCLERSNGIDAQAFIDFYESKGWLIGKNPMKDWKAAVRTWEQRHKEDLKRYGTKQRNSKFADPDETMRAMLAGINAGITERNNAQNAFTGSAPY